MPEPAGWGDDAPDVILEARARRDALEAALIKLPEQDREILLLRDVEGLSGDDTARILALSLPAMKSRLHRARLRLAAELRQGGDHGS